jgi:hypothetical protein
MGKEGESQEDKPRRLTLKDLREDTIITLKKHQFRIESLEMRLAIIEDWLERVLKAAQDDDKTFH